MTKQEQINFFDFVEKYKTEEKYHEHLFQQRWLNSFIYPKCENNKYYPKKGITIINVQSVDIKLRYLPER